MHNFLVEKLENTTEYKWIVFQLSDPFDTMGIVVDKKQVNHMLSKFNEFIKIVEDKKLETSVIIDLYDLLWDNIEKILRSGITNRESFINFKEFKKDLKKIIVKILNKK